MFNIMICQHNTANVKKKLKLDLFEDFMSNHLLQSLKQKCPPRALLLPVSGGETDKNL